jgi:hypothetical protein
VAGGEADGAEPVGEPEHRVDPHLAVAQHARVGGAPFAVAADERAHHALAEDLLEIEGQVRDPERVGEPAGAEDGERRAAALGGVGAPVGPQLHRHPDNLRPVLALEQRGDRGVDPAAHRDQHALAACRRAGERHAGAGEAGERPVDGVGGQLGGVAALRGEAAEGVLDVGWSDQGGVEGRRAVGELGDCRAGSLGGCAALCLEAGAEALVTKSKGD